jgi:hypothetical protein
MAPHTRLHQRRTVVEQSPVEETVKETEVRRCMNGNDPSDSSSSPTTRLNNATATTGNDLTTTLKSSVPPPWHTAMLLILFLTLSLRNLPSLQSLDEIAVPERLATPLFHGISTVNLAIIRGCIACLIWAVTLQMTLGPGWIQQTAYRPNSKLRSIPNHMRGIKTLFPFTSM